jgi:hypothetical protein
MFLNLMFKFSGKFRKEFRRTFGIWCCDERRFSRRRRCMSTIHAGSSTYVCRYTTGGSTSYTARTEIVPLSGISSNVTIADADWHRSRALPPMPWTCDARRNWHKGHRLFSQMIFTLHWNRLLCRNSKDFRCCFLSEYRSWVHYMDSTDLSIRQLDIHWLCCITCTLKTCIIVVFSSSDAKLHSGEG